MPDSSLKADQDLPVQKSDGGRCHYCTSPGLRRSRFRSDDLLYLLVLQWPVRCMACSKRQHVFLFTARKAISSKAAHSGEFRSQETWQGYTGSDVQQSKPSDEDNH